jgi:hypothetical protein
MFVKPAPGLKIRDPKSKLHIPESGAEVPEETFWIRRLADGDVVICEPPKSEPVIVPATKEE